MATKKQQRTGDKEPEKQDPIESSVRACQAKIDAALEEFGFALAAEIRQESTSGGGLFLKAVPVLRRIEASPF